MKDGDQEIFPSGHRAGAGGRRRLGSLHDRRRPKREDANAGASALVTYLLTGIALSLGLAALVAESRRLIVLLVSLGSSSCLALLASAGHLNLRPPARRWPAIGICAAAVATPLGVAFFPSRDDIVDTLRVQVIGGSESERVAQFFIPEGVDWGNYPDTLVPSPGCSPEQFRWAQEHGEIERQAQVVRLTNLGSQAFSLLDLSAVNVVESKPVSGFLFDCPNAGQNDYVRVFADLDVSDKFKIDGDRPFGGRLEPGESLDIEVSSRSFTINRKGDLKLTIVQGESEPKFLPIRGSNGPLWSAFGRQRELLMVFPGPPGKSKGLYCVPPGKLDYIECDGEWINGHLSTIK